MLSADQSFGKRRVKTSIYNQTQRWIYCRPDQAFKIVWRIYKTDVVTQWVARWHSCRALALQC